jgi:hypothetical protein
METPGQDDDADRGVERRMSEYAVLFVCTV